MNGVGIKTKIKLTSQKNEDEEEIETIKTNNLSEQRERNIPYQQRILTTGLKDDLSIYLNTRIETKQQRRERMQGVESPTPQ